jgi:hypothetical protein
MKNDTPKSKRWRKPSWPRIRVRGTSWVVDCGKVFGKRERKQCDDPEEAEEYAKAQRSRRTTLRETERFEAANRSVHLSNLTDSQRMDALKAIEILASRGSLVAAAEFWVKHSAPASGTRTSSHAAISLRPLSLNGY